MDKVRFTFGLREAVLFAVAAILIAVALAYANF
jgi:hypothetical protein